MRSPLDIIARLGITTQEKITIATNFMAGRRYGILFRRKNIANNETLFTQMNQITDSSETKNLESIKKKTAW